MSVTLASNIGSHLYIIAQTFATERRVETVLLARARGVEARGERCETRAGRARVANRLAWLSEAERRERRSARAAVP